MYTLKTIYYISSVRWRSR